jgi:hypothetical protein
VAAVATGWAGARGRRRNLELRLFAALAAGSSLTFVHPKEL